MSATTTEDQNPPRAEKIEGRVQLAIMLAIGCAGAAASFSHVHAVAANHGQVEWIAWADAVVLELMSVASGLEMRRRKRLHHPTRWPFLVLLIAVTLSLAAQIIEAEQSLIGCVAASVPALGFLAMAKMALGRGTPPSTPVAIVEPTTSAPAPAPMATLAAAPAPAAEVEVEPEPEPAPVVKPRPTTRTRRTPAERKAQVEQARAELPDGATAPDIAAAVGITDRHVRRVLSEATA